MYINLYDPRAERGKEKISDGVFVLYTILF